MQAGPPAAQIRIMRGGLTVKATMARDRTMGGKPAPERDTVASAAVD